MAWYQGDVEFLRTEKKMKKTWKISKKRIQFVKF